MPETIIIFNHTISLYYLIWFLAILIALLIGITIAKDFGFSVYTAVTYTSVALIIGYFVIWITSVIFDGFNLVRSVVFLPLIYFLQARIFKESFSKLSDFMAPIGVSCFGVTHFGCIFPGCCHGYPSTWGVYSNVAEKVCFPIQPIEAITSLLIGGLMYLMVKRRWQKGRLIFWMMTLFGSTRFVLEFFRDNHKIFLNISELSLHALATFVVGVVGIIIFKCFDKKEHMYEKI